MRGELLALFLQAHILYLVVRALDPIAALGVFVAVEVLWRVFSHPAVTRTQGHQGESLILTSLDMIEKLSVGRAALFSDQRRVPRHIHTSWPTPVDPSSSCSHRVYVPTSLPPPPRPHG